MPISLSRYRGVDASLLVRTDYSDDAAWGTLCITVQQPSTGDGFVASFAMVSDARLAGLSPDAIGALVFQDLRHTVVFIADHRTLFDPEHPVLCVTTSESPLAAFRVIPSEIWGPENNLRLCNMDFAEFASAVEADGVFRGFRG
jgi:hypothetical protein